MYKQKKKKLLLILLQIWALKNNLALTDEKENIEINYVDQGYAEQESVPRATLTNYCITNWVA